MRLLHVYGGNLYGGVERLLVSLARFQRFAPGLEQEFALCYAGRLSRELEAQGASIHWLGGVRVSRPWQVLAARRRLVAWLSQQHFNLGLCHSWWPYAIFGPALRRAGIPVGLWVHQAVTGQGWLERWTARHRPDVLFTNTQAMASAAKRLFPQPAARVLAPPVQLPPALTAGERADFRRHYGVGDGQTVILQIGRMEQGKGHGLLLQALAGLLELPDWTAWVVGGAQRSSEQAYLRALQRQAAQLGLSERVRWLGEQDDISRFMGAADIFCQPNIRPETFGIVFVEALAAGLPVVTTAQGGALAIVTPECGRLTPPETGAVSRALRSLILDAGLRRRLAGAGPARALTLCGPESQMRRFQQLLVEAAR